MQTPLHRFLYCLAASLSLMLACGSTAALAQKSAQEESIRDTLKSYRKSDKFYDSVYYKFQRKKFTKLIYPFAFKTPEGPVVHPAVTEKSETPYLPFSGKIIRKVRVDILPPFETSVYDTNSKARSATAKYLNGIHVNTQAYVIRKELLFKPGDRLNPFMLAENERSIRDLSAIDNVKFYVRETSPGSDSVDITVVTKDVWSIWGNLITVTSKSVRFSLYDANFLGLNDILNVGFSMNSTRSPFFRVSGVDYIYSNIYGTFISGLFNYAVEDDGNQVIRVGFDRQFFVPETRWAGSAFYTNRIQVENKYDTLSIHSRYHQEFAWLGVSFPMSKIRRDVRFVLAEAFDGRQYQSRPEVSPTSDPLYYNFYDFLTGFCFYRNRYYTAYYVAQFGKPENIPYGHNIQFTIGPQLSEFSTRMYGGLTYSAGNLVDNIGYLRGQVTLGGFLSKATIEDGITKVSLDYFSNLYTTHNNRYKFRNYITARYGYGFNLNIYRDDKFNLNRLFNLPSLNSDSALEGQHCFGIKVSNMMFTPWHIYGFMFAMTAYAEAGFVSGLNVPAHNANFYGGFGIGVKIKNDNLIFPPFLISFAFYPGNQPGVNFFQVDLSSDPWVRIPNFRAGAPRIETLGN